MKSTTWIGAALIAAMAAGCFTRKNPEFCDEQIPCEDSDAPFCDLTGEHGGIGNTCIADPRPDASPPDANPAEEHTLTVSVAGSGAGAVTISDPPGGSCSTGTCMFSVVDGSTVTLAAPASTGSTFIDWGGNCTGTDNPCVLDIDGDKAATATFNTAGDPLFSHRIGTSGAGVWIRDIAVDPAGNVAVTGEFAGSVDFGGTSITAVGGPDLFTAKYTSAGNLVWVQREGEKGRPSVGQGVTFDTSGNVVVAGFKNHRYVFIVGTPPPATVAYVAKLATATGAVIWEQEIGSLTGDSDDGRAFARIVAIDSSGDVLVAGDFTGQVRFAPGTDLFGLDFDVFVARYSSSGVFENAVQIGSSADDRSGAISIDSTDAYIVVGRFGRGAFVAKYTADDVAARPLRVLTSPSAGSVFARAISMDPAGGIFLAGSHFGDADFGDGVTLPSSATTAAFAANFDSAGTARWAKSFAQTDMVYAHDCIADPRGTLILVGEYKDVASFGGPLLPSSGGMGSIFVTSLDAATGDHRWSKGFGDDADTDIVLSLPRLVDAGNAAALANDGTIVVSGNFSGLVDFGVGTEVCSQKMCGFWATFSP